MLRKALIEDISGLANLRIVEGDFVFKDNPNFVHFNHLNNVTQVIGNLEFLANANLTRISGFGGLTQTGGDLRISRPPDQEERYSSYINEGSIYSNPNLTTIDGFTRLIAINGSLFLREGCALERIDGFTNLTSVGQDLVLGLHFSEVPLTFDPLIDDPPMARCGNDVLVDFSGLASLESVGRHLNINRNGALEDLAGFASLRRVGWLTLIENDALDSLQGLETLEIIDNDLISRNNDPTLVPHVEALRDRLGAGLRGEAHIDP